jgi:hypothetical protein
MRKTRLRKNSSSGSITRSFYKVFMQTPKRGSFRALGSGEARGSGGKLRIGFGQSTSSNHRRPDSRGTLTPSDLLSAVGLKPAADVDLGVRLAAVVPCSALISGLLVPLEDCQLCIAAVDNDPPDRVLALFATDFTSVNCVNHSRPPCFSKATKV